MTIKQWKTLIKTSLLMILFSLLPFLPGPSALSPLANTVFSLTQLLGMFGLLLIPIGLVWTIRQEILNKQKPKKIFPILLWIVPALAMFFSFGVANIARDFSRNFAMSRSEGIITAIEKYKLENSRYPDELLDLAPKHLKDLPKPWIMGIPRYRYKKKEDSYNLSFTQNVLIAFNMEVVIYDPRNQHKAEGELQKLYDTGKPNWRYYVYD